MYKVKNTSGQTIPTKKQIKYVNHAVLTSLLQKQINAQRI